MIIIRRFWHPSDVNSRNCHQVALFLQSVTDKWKRISSKLCLMQELCPYMTYLIFQFWSWSRIKLFRHCKTPFFEIDHLVSQRKSDLHFWKKKNRDDSLFYLILLATSSWYHEMILQSSSIFNFLQHWIDKNLYFDFVSSFFSSYHAYENFFDIRKCRNCLDLYFSSSVSKLHDVSLERVASIRTKLYTVSTNFLISST